MNRIFSYKYFLSVTLLIISNLSIAAITPDQQALLDTLPPDQRAGIMEKMMKSDDLTAELEEVFEDDPTLIVRPEREMDEKEIQESLCQECIYGYNFFKYSPSTFAPVTNGPISADYVLGPGDKLRVNYYGSIDKEVETYVSREGSVILPQLGPLNLMGMNFKDASDFIKKEASVKLIGTDISISLSELRSISIFVLGEAYLPGKYTISGLSNVSNALFVSGGVNENGSLRNIQVKRNNKIISTYDFYDFLLNGSIGTEVNLQDGDVIFIPFIEKKVKIGGAFKRPHIYEFKEGETVSDAIKFAGGVTSQVLPKSSVELNSVDPELFSRKLYYIPLGSEKLNRKLQNEDVINISSKADLLPGTVTLSGEVVNPGEYSILQGDTILDLIERAGGFSEDSFSEGAVYLRKDVAKQQKEGFLRTAEELENTMIDIIRNMNTTISEYSLAPVSKLISRLRTEEPLGRFVVDIDYLALKTDPLKNFRVRSGDSLYIPKRPDSVSVVGEVLNSSTMSYNPKYNAKDYINSSGGLNNSADPDRIFIISPSGKSSVMKNNLFASRNKILPGSTIVIPRDPRPLDAVGLTQIITPVLADLATSAAAIAALSD